MELTTLDFAAAAWFFLAWGLYTLIADRGHWSEKSVSATMGRYRQQWMMTMLRRDNRMLDSGIIGNLLNGSAFFASTSIFVVGGLFALLGAGDQAIAVIDQLPFTAATTPGAWQAKVLLLIAVFVFAFFKFVWSFRLFNYCSILIGATPVSTEIDKKGEQIGERAGRINSLAARHLNRGLRAYSFALAVLAWFLHPVFFMVCTTWVVYVLYRREFHSRSVKVLRESS